MERTISPQRFRQIALITLILLALITVTGGAVRLTGSGLGCSDWPTCEQNQLVPSVSFHSAIEFGNRVISGLVGVAAFITVIAAIRREPQRKDLIRLSAGIVGGIVAQIVVGAIVVQSEVNPWVVMIHFLLSMVLIWNGVLLFYRAGIDDSLMSKGLRFKYRPQAWVITTITAAVLIAGSLVSHSGPHTGATDDHVIPRLPFDISDIVKVHSGLVWLLMAVLLSHAWWLSRNRASTAEQRRLWAVIALVVAQGALGYSQYFSGVPPVMVAVHIAGAVVIWIAVLWYHLNSRAEPVEHKVKVGNFKPVLAQP